MAKVVASGARLVTARGLTPVQEIVKGDLVLTHEARFAPVLTVQWEQVRDATLYRLGNGPLCCASTRAYAWNCWWPILGETKCTTKYHTVNPAEWERSDRRSRELVMKTVRGQCIQAKPGVVVLGVSPAHIFGELLFASRLDGNEEWGIMPETYSGRVYSVLVEGHDQSFVADRFCLR